MVIRFQNRYNMTNKYEKKRNPCQNASKNRGFESQKNKKATTYFF